jgi:hypothetical protein
MGLLFRGRARRIKLRRGQVKVVGLWIKCHRFRTVLTSLSLFLRWSAPGDQITEAGRSVALQEGSVWKEAFRHAYNTFFGNGVSTNAILNGGFLNKNDAHLSCASLLWRRSTRKGKQLGVQCLLPGGPSRNLGAIVVISMGNLCWLQQFVKPMPTSTTLPSAFAIYRPVTIQIIYRSR